MATQMVPSASVQAKAQVLLAERDDWRYWRDARTGVEYVSVTSGKHVYAVRRDGRGCSCPAYVRGGLLCSHRIAAIEAAHEDSLALGLATDAEIDATAAGIAADARAREKARLRAAYDRLFGDD